MNKCLICKKEYVVLNPVCDTCLKAFNETEDRNVLKIRDYIYNFQLNNIETAAKELGLPAKILRWYLYKGKIKAGVSKSFASGLTGALTVSDKMYGNYIWVEVKGRIDSLTSYEFQTYLNNIINTDIVIDMGDVSFFSSNGVRVVLSTYKQLLQSGSFQIANPSKSVANILGMVSLERMLLK